MEREYISASSGSSSMALLAGMSKRLGWGTRTKPEPTALEVSMSGS